jgi:hypothetical protein
VLRQLSVTQFKEACCSRLGGHTPVWNCQPLMLTPHRDGGCQCLQVRYCVSVQVQTARQSSADKGHSMCRVPRVKGACSPSPRVVASEDRCHTRAASFSLSGDYRAEVDGCAQLPPASM